MCFYSKNAIWKSAIRLSLHYALTEAYLLSSVFILMSIPIYEKYPQENNRNFQKTLPLSSLCILFLLLLVVKVEMVPRFIFRALHKQGVCSATEIFPQSPNIIFSFFNSPGFFAATVVTVAVVVSTVTCILDVILTHFVVVFARVPQVWHNWLKCLAVSTPWITMLTHT